MATAISPSPEARHIYNMMVTRAQPCGGSLHVSLAQSIELSVALGRRGQDISASRAVTELQDADWISPASHGGWRVA
jgi:hypothetical protein